MSANVTVDVQIEANPDRSEWTRALEMARDEWRKAYAEWEDTGDVDLRDAGEVGLDLLNRLIARGPPQ